MKVLAGILMFPIVFFMAVVMFLLLAVGWVCGVPIKITQGDKTKSYRWFTQVR